MIEAGFCIHDAAVGQGILIGGTASPGLSELSTPLLICFLLLRDCLPTKSGHQFFVQFCLHLLIRRLAGEVLKFARVCI